MRIPDLGRDGQGWVVLQMLCIAAIAVAGAVGPAWVGALRIIVGALGIALIGAGWVLGIVGWRALGTAFSPNPRPVSGGQLVVTGIYARVRHPIYGGLILAAMGWGLSTASLPALGLAAVLAAIFLLKSVREEAWLLERYPGYAAYRRRTNRFLPSPIRIRRPA
ncbi:MAG: methyltransferase family protein [Candidatus Limnocylindrales bacterium]